MGGVNVEISVYGDSILKGVMLEDRRYVVNREWEQRFAETFGCRISNRSRFGCTIDKAMAVIRRDADLSPAAGDLAVLEFGGNDCDYDWSAIAADPAGDHEPKTPPEQFLVRYRQAIELLRGSGRQPVVLTLPPIHSERYLRFICRNGLSQENILRWMGNVERISLWQESYSALAEQAARETGTPLVDLRAVFPRESAALEPLLCSDGIHPSRPGQRLIYEKLSRRAAEVLRA